MSISVKYLTLPVLVISAVVLTSGCIAKDGVDFAYEAYQHQKSQCQRSPDISQRDACMHVAAEQMVGSIENHLSQFGPVQEQGNMMQMKLKSDDDINRKHVILPQPPPYIPPKPQAGPTIESLSVPASDAEDSEEEKSDEDRDGQKPENVEEQKSGQSSTAE